MRKTIDFKPVIFQNEKLKIKEISIEEYHNYFVLLYSNRDRLVRYFPSTVSKVLEPNNAKQYLKECLIKRDNLELFPFGIYSNSKLIGWISIRTIDWEKKKCELGYYIDKEYEGLGISSMSIAEIIKFCFQLLKMETIFLRIGKDNIGSQKIAEKNNFKCKDVLKNNFQNENGVSIDLLYYELKRCNLNEIDNIKLKQYEL